MAVESRGQVTESAIRLFSEPQTVAFARGRGEITTVSRSLLSVPLNNTDTNIRLKTSLLKRIARMSNGKTISYNTIRFEWLYNEVSASNRMQKKRTLDATVVILDHFKKEGKIKGYTIENQKILIKPIKK